MDRDWLLLLVLGLHIIQALYIQLPFVRLNQGINNLETQRLIAARRS